MGSNGKDYSLWDGRNRREAASNVDALQREFIDCKREVDMEIEEIHESVRQLRTEVHGLREDVHRVAESVGSMKTSLETIATTLSKLADFPDTWSRIQGFWAVMRWFRSNIIPLTIVLGVLFYTAYLGLRAAGLPSLP